MNSAAAHTLTAAEANRKFSEMLRNVRDGRSIVITVHGQPAAKLIPFDGDISTADGARHALLTRLRRQKAVHAGRWTRESLYRR